MTLEDIRKELDVVMKTIPAFTKSRRGKWLYNAKDKRNEKVKVHFAGNNFKVMVGQSDLLIKSVPMSKLKVDKVKAYLVMVLNR